MNISPTPIFSKEFIEHYNSGFLLNNFPNIRAKREIIARWIKELNSGKLDSLKEEEVKSRFVIDIFGRVLDFKFDHSKNWFLKEEAKMVSSGKKSDAALGYFGINKSSDDVRAVIEIKDAKTDLEKKQNRKIKISAIEQAFEYGENIGEKCRWVIVSNFKEIRFYNRNSPEIYQNYNLEDLADESVLKEFILLFHKDRFISFNKDSQTDKLHSVSFKPITKKEKNMHILDQMYHCVSKFDGLVFVDPNYIASLSPFNILNTQVWHYEYNSLFTLNNAIYSLLEEISIENNEIKLSKVLERELSKEKISEPLVKLRKIFRFLNKCMISTITAVKDYKTLQEALDYPIQHFFNAPEDQKINLNISINAGDTCDCLNCNFRNFEFAKLLTKLKSNNGSVDFFDSEYAYGNYMTATNDYKTSFQIYKHLENLKGKEDKAVEYFLTRLNMKYLHNLIRSNYEGEDNENIIENIRFIDLDDVIFNELEYEIDNDVKKYLIQIKEEKLLNKVREQIRKNSAEIQKLKSLYDRGGGQYGGTDIVARLKKSYLLLHEHVNKNFIIQNIFTDYRNISKELFAGLIESYKTKEVGMQEFHGFFIRDAVIHLGIEDLKEILKDVAILNIERDSIKNLIDLFSNFFTSFYKGNASFSGLLPNTLLAESSISYDLRNNLSRIFSNIFIMLLKSNIKKEDFKVIQTPILSFLKTENILYHSNLDALSRFLEKKGDFFELDNLVAILKTAVYNDDSQSHKYERLVSSCSRSIRFYYPEFKIEDEALIKKAVSNCSALSYGRPKIQDYVHLSKICSAELQRQLLDVTDQYLDTYFNDRFYWELLNFEIYQYTYKNYFEKFLDEICKYGGSIEFKDGESTVHNFTFLNFIWLIHSIDIQLTIEQKNKFQRLNKFEEWLLDPFDFDYTLFESCWLVHILNNRKFAASIKNISEIKVSLEKELKEKFDQKLSNFYVQHFI
ncbi:hypothetical protein ASE21_14860 [Flavobacterium sp. Root901]|uniref:hypothetical protein n=1 Tax=Flavobacterium sp. Root901 TaxID=1736605 RepID=UPI00070E98CD|nr:hypothetical protein [Flavobacterium sp. Root901]KRD09125.1 hypothetical protein ASE21_14860 [Flavobacterium sp. Root901]